MSTAPTTTPDQPDAPSSGYTIKSAATDPAKTLRAVPAAPVEEPVKGKTGRESKRRDWYTGFCTSGPCQDGRFTDAEGNPKHHCRGIGENGAKITPRYVYCACTCHTENPNAVQIEREA